MIFTKIKTLGQLLPKDITKAIQLYEEAASYGNTTAINNLG